MNKEELTTVHFGNDHYGTLMPHVFAQVLLAVRQPHPVTPHVEKLAAKNLRALEWFLVQVAILIFHTDTPTVMSYDVSLARDSGASPRPQVAGAGTASRRRRDSDANENAPRLGGAFC